MTKMKKVEGGVTQTRVATETFRVSGRPSTSPVGSRTPLVNWTDD